MQLIELNGKKVWSETGSKFNKPTVNKRYVKILFQCLDEAYIRDIYPNSKFPLEHQLRDMMRAELVTRYKKKGYRGYFYKTTSIGKDLLIATIKNTK